MSVPSVRGMGRVAGVECGKLVGELSRELLAGAHEAADAAYVWNISSAEPLGKQVHEEDEDPPDAAVFDTRYGI